MRPHQCVFVTISLLNSVSCSPRLRSCFSFPLSNMLFQRWLKQLSQGTEEEEASLPAFFSLPHLFCFRLTTFFGETMKSRPRPGGQMWGSSSLVLVLQPQHKFCLLLCSNFSPGSSSVHIFVFLFPPSAKQPTISSLLLVPADKSVHSVHFVPEEQRLFCRSRNKDIPVRKMCPQLLEGCTKTTRTFFFFTGKSFFSISSAVFRSSCEAVCLLLLLLL